ncbi:hypothetical protein SHO565_18810 [Streptomyces sp. HO565]
MDGLVAGADLAAHLHAAAVREPDVEHRYVRTGGGDPGERVGRRAGLADDLDVGLARQQIVHTPTDDLMVVEEKYPDFSVFAHALSQTHELFPCPGWPG